MGPPCPMASDSSGSLGHRPHNFERALGFVCRLYFQLEVLNHWALLMTTGRDYFNKER